MTNSLLEFSCLPQHGKITVEKVAVDYVLEPDTDDDSDNYQVLRLETVYVPAADPGNCHYIRMSIIEGNHISVNSYEDLKPIFDDFETRVNDK